MSREQGCWHRFCNWFITEATSYERAGCLLPTRLVYNFILRGSLNDSNGGVFQFKWPRKWLLAEILLCAIGLMLPLLCYSKSPSFISGFPKIAGIVATCRVLEIIYAYLGELPRLVSTRNDGLDAVHGVTMGQRAMLAITSYPSLLLNWALIYFWLPSGWFNYQVHTDDDHGLVNMLYFSGTTLTTVGFGDITPIHWMVRLLTVAEALSGMLVIVAALATYLAKLSSEK